MGGGGHAWSWTVHPRIQEDAMSIDIQIGLLLGLVLVCVGGFLTFVVMAWLEGRSHGRTPPGGEWGEPGPLPSPEPAWDVPQFVPDEWVREAA
jgi:hypothetical protein